MNSIQWIKFYLNRHLPQHLAWHKLRSRHCYSAVRVCLIGKSSRTTNRVSSFSISLRMISASSFECAMDFFASNCIHLGNPNAADRLISGKESHCSSSSPFTGSLMSLLTSLKRLLLIVGGDYPMLWIDLISFFLFWYTDSFCRYRAGDRRWLSNDDLLIWTDSVRTVKRLEAFSHRREKFHSFGIFHRRRFIFHGTFISHEGI